MFGKLADDTVVHPVTILQSPADAGADLPIQLDQRRVGGLQHALSGALHQSDEIDKSGIRQGAHAKNPDNSVFRCHGERLSAKPGQPSRLCKAGVQFID
jgi:hypothetical protein